MLRALKQLLRPGGRIAFTTIHVASGLDAASRQRARRSGPRAVASRREHTDLLRSAGFVDIDHVDVTASFADTARGWLREFRANYDDLAAMEPPGAFDQRLRDGARQLRAVEAGLLRRGLFAAGSP